MEYSWYRDRNASRLAFHLFLIASYEGRNYQGIELRAGQAVVGRVATSQILGMSEQEFRTAIQKLVRSGFATVKSTNKFSVVTLNDWSFGRDDNLNLTNRLTNPQPARNQRSTTLKEFNEIKKSGGAIDSRSGHIRALLSGDL